MTSRAPSRATSRTLSRAAKQHRTGDTGATLIRIVIASYFLAMSIGLVPGLNVQALTGAVLPEAAAGIVASGVVFTLSFLLLIGVAAKAAALLLALTLFWSSYISMVSLGFAEALGVFWRDLALVGALLLACRDAEAGRSLFRYIPDVRKIRLGNGPSVRPRRIVSEPAVAKKVAPLIPLGAVTDEDLAEPHRAAG